MTTSHRLRTSAGAAALAAALVLVPTAAFADEAPAAAPAAPAASGTADAAAAAPVAPSDAAPAAEAPAADPSSAPVDASAPAPAAPADDAAATPTSTPGNTTVGQRPAPAAGVAAAQPAAADPAAPATRGAGTVVVVAPEVDPLVEAYPGVAHPGSTFSVYVEGFTPGDAVSARVDGDAVSPDDVFTVYPGQLPFVFDSSGSAWFDVDVPADLPFGILTVTVSDAHDLTSSTEVPVTAPIPAPAVVAPVGATAGVVTVTGSGGQPGQAAVVVVGQPDYVDDGFGFGFAFGSGGSSSADAPADETVDETTPDLSSLVVTTAAQAEAAPEDDFYDVEPVQFTPGDGAATALVPIAADGTFSARFVLPAGDFGTTAIVIDTETSDTSLPAAVAPFTVAAAAAPVVLPAAPAAVPVNTVVATRGGSLAYTGTESALPAGIAAAALLLGAVLTTTARLRRRSA